MRKTLIFTLTLIFLVTLMPASGAHYFVSAETCILIEAETGKVLYEKNADEQRPMASTTKLMTALTVLENCETDEMVTVAPEAVGIEGTSMYLRYGETVTVHELLCGLLVASGNDAAAALAYHVSGGIAEFADLMNAKADELGLLNTHFSNPHGLDEDGHYSSARDLALTYRELLEFGEFRDIIGSRSVQCAGREFTNHNKLLWSCDGMIGGKTGYTSGAGRCLVTAAERGGMTLICATMSAPDDWNDHTTLLNAGFTGFRRVTLNDIFRQLELPVISGETDSVTVIADGGFTDVIAQSELPTVEVYCPDFVYAPCGKGDTVGEIVIRTNGGETALPLVYGESVNSERAEKHNIFDRIKLLLRGMR